MGVVALAWHRQAKHAMYTVAQEAQAAGLLVTCPQLSRMFLPSRLVGQAGLGKPAETHQPGG